MTPAPSVQPWTKRIMQFQPSALVSVAESDRHYRQVHSAWATDIFRTTDSLVSYHTNLLTGQWDLRGGFGRTPDLWRYAAMRSDPLRGLEFAPGTAALLSHDHQNFLRELRRFDVEETVRFDCRSGQMTSAKFVLVLDRPEGGDAEQAADAVAEVTDTVSTALERSYGARLLVANRVLCERENVAMREPGQRPTGRILPDSTRLAFLEIWFDEQIWGEEFFCRPELLALQTSSVFAPAAITAYRVDERSPHDRR